MMSDIRSTGFSFKSMEIAIEYNIAIEAETGFEMHPHRMY